MSSVASGSHNFPLYKGKYQVVIGLEIHCQLATKSKIFCGCSVQYPAANNANVCPVCLGLPGALPVLNAKAVRYAVLMGHAIGGTIHTHSRFARKNYFYPDLPKGYQISQFDRPYCEGGEVVLENGRTINVTRIHMEEDAGKNSHIGRTSLVNLNRAGVPLIEIVSEPEMHSAEEAVSYARKIHQLVRYLDISNANMEEGNFRCDANVSIRIPGDPLGTRTELKNMNSFRFLEAAIDQEILRQIELVASGQRVILESRGYDDAKKETFSMRSKEEAHDYRYFPDPDLPELVIAPTLIAALKQQLPELPDAKCRRYMETYAFNEDDSGFLCRDRAVSSYFEAVVAAGGDGKMTKNWLRGELQKQLLDRNLLIEKSPVTALRLAALLVLVKEGQVSQSAAKTVLQEMFLSDKPATDIVSEKGLGQITDTSAMEKMVDDVIAKNPNQAAQYRAGKTQLLGFFVGQIMKASRGQANPAVVNALVKSKLEG